MEELPDEWGENMKKGKTRMENHNKREYIK